LRLDPRPTVEVGLQALGANGPVRQSMRRQNREGQTAKRTKTALDPFLAGAFRIGVAQVVPMAVDRPRTTAGTEKSRSGELIESDLNVEQKPESSRQIKPLSFGLHDTVRPLLLANVPFPRSQISSRLNNIPDGPLYDAISHRRYSQGPPFLASRLWYPTAPNSLWIIAAIHYFFMQPVQLPSQLRGKLFDALSVNPSTASIDECCNALK
jgi:hypothetical protein